MSGLGLTIHQDIAHAETLPARFYSDPEIFEAVRERIFARSWQLVGDSDSIKAPGQTYPFTLLEGCLNEPMVLTRDFEDRVHCLSNVCTHRGTIVCEGPGMERHLRCRYHGRRFGLDGCFQHMPEFEQAKNFPSKKDDLKQFPLERWGKFLFTSLNPSMPIGDWLEPMRTRLSGLPVDECVFDAARSREYLVQANWALYCDNYLEGFHIPYVHASLSEVLDYGSYHTELYAWSNLQLGIAKDSEDAFEPPRDSGGAAQDSGKRIAAYYFWLFPNLMMNVYPWGISVNVVRPLAVDRTRVSFLTYVWDRARLERGGGAGAGLDRVEREDEAIVEAVQRGVRSRFYDRGRYSPTREQGVHHFHRLLANALG